MGGTGPAGFAGLKDKVNNHYWRIFGAATLLSVISATSLYSQNDDEGGERNTRSAREELAAEVGRQWSQVGQQMTRSNLQIQPTLEIRPGNRLNVMVNRDLILIPYDEWPRGGGHHDARQLRGLSTNGTGNRIKDFRQPAFFAHMDSATGGVFLLQELLRDGRNSAQES